MNISTATREDIIIFVKKLEDRVKLLEENNQLLLKENKLLKNKIQELEKRNA